ncbi:T9SS type A sorting domain-containing protein [bacterium]|nr:T9SS type A sorting domain-containing protein [bacterium]
MRLPVCVVTLACLAGTAVPVRGVDYQDDFSAGIDSTFWNPNTNQPLYTMDDSSGDIRLSKPVGGTYSFQTMRVDFLGNLDGDFDASVSFQDAVITRSDGEPGNQIQLNVRIGNEGLSVVRSDEVPAGNQVHVWDGSAWRGEQATSASAGTFRIARTGSVLSGYWNSTLLHSVNYGTGTAQALWFSLQNNGTKDSTSVTFDDFAVVAQGISTGVPAGPVAMGDLRVFPNPFRGSVLLSYSVREPANCVAEVYGVDGRLLGRTAFRSPGRGDQTVPLDADLFGAGAGVYFVRLQTGLDTRTARVVRLSK